MPTQTKTKSTSRTALKIVQKYYPQVSSLVDAKKPVTINVTPEDCKQGKSGAPSECAMARAFSREYDGAIISKSISYLVRGKVALRYRTPESVTREIISFDRNNNFQPGEYGLRAPEQSAKLSSTRKHRATAHSLTPPGVGHRLGGHQGGPVGVSASKATLLKLEAMTRKKAKKAVKRHHTAGVRALV